MVALAALLAPTAPMAHADEPVPLGGGSGLVVNGETLCTLTAIGNDNRGNLIGFTSAHCGGPGAQVGAEGAEASGVLGTMVAGNDAPRLRGDPVRPAEGQAGQQRRRLPDRRPRPRPGHRRDRVQAGPHHRLFVRRHLGPRRGARHHRQPGVRSAGRLRGAGHGQQPAGRHDPRRVHRRPADLHHQVHPAAHAGGHHVDQRACSRTSAAKNRPGSGFVPVGG